MASDTCGHVNTERVRKFDSGRCPVLCDDCRLIIGYWYLDDLREPVIVEFS